MARRLATRATLVLTAALTLCPAVSVAGTPAGFFGTMVDGPALDPGVDLGRELDLMRSSGVATIRVAFDWSRAQPESGSATSFADSDRIVASAARRRLVVLPVVLWAPVWARREPAKQASPPQPGAYAAFVAGLARRYGPRGSLWRERTSLPRVPIRDWQIWNEPTVENFWTIQPFERDYVELLRRTRASLRAVDRRARVVSAGLVYESWRALERLYRAGARGRFDVLALHPFTSAPKDVLRIVELNRRVMKRHRDARRPVFLTEVSWPSSRDKIGERYGYETDEAGQARKLSAALPLIARERRRLGIERAYWYTWLTRETDPEYPFDYAGLRRLDEDGRIVSKPALSAFRRAVARLRGRA